jgi:hypothetical protein
LLAYQPSLWGKKAFQDILSEPLKVIGDTLLVFKNWEEMLLNLPDLTVV